MRWCRDEGVAEIPDLLGRAVTPPTFEEEWPARCHAIGEETADSE